MEEQRNAIVGTGRFRIVFVAAGLILGMLLGNLLIKLWESNVFLEKCAPQDINTEAVHSFTLCQMQEGRTFLKEQRYRLSMDVQFQEVLDALTALECEKTEQECSGEDYRLELLDEEGKVLYRLAFDASNRIEINGETYEIAISEEHCLVLFLFRDILHPGEYPAATFGDEVAQEPDIMDNVTMEINYITYEGACGILRNESDRAYEIGSGWWVEAYRDGKWYHVNFLPNSAAFALGAYTLDNEEVTYLMANWADYNGILPGGRYRLRKDLRDISSNEEYDIAVEFSLPENSNSVLYR